MPDGPGCNLIDFDDDELVSPSQPTQPTELDDDELVSVSSLRVSPSEPTELNAMDLNWSKPDAQSETNFLLQYGLSETNLKVIMHSPAPYPQIDEEATLIGLKDTANRLKLNARTHNMNLAPLSSHVVLEEGSECYCMSVTLDFGMYDLQSSHEVAPNWMAASLQMGRDNPNLVTNGRLRSMYGPMINALVARLKQTIFALLSHENLGLHEIEASVDLGNKDGTMTVELTIDPLTSQMLRERFTEYDRLKTDSNIETFDVEKEILRGFGHNDPIPYGCEDLLWGQTLSEMLWLAGAEMRPDLERRNDAAFRQCLCDAERLKPPNAPPHDEEEQSEHGRRVVHWNLAVAPMVLAVC